jgi:aspartyl aminopeptidase
MVNSAEKLLEFVHASPSPFHCAWEASKMLKAAGFTRVREGDEVTDASLTKGYRLRNGAVIAWIKGEITPSEAGFRMVGAHTDSPNLRLKPRPEYTSNGYHQWGVERYGGPILATWTDRDLGISGRVALRGKDGEVDTALVRIERPVARIPNVAIHYNREVNREGLKLNVQKHLPPIVGLGGETEGDEVLRELILESLTADGHSWTKSDILGWDLGLHDLQKPSLGGVSGEFIYAPRMDNQFSCFAALQAMTTIVSPKQTAIMALFDHEEVGSQSDSGAKSALLEQTLKILVPDGKVEMAMARSFMVSVDMAHGVHPNYADYHDPKHRPRINGGPVIKTNVNMRYATDALGAAKFRLACEAEGVGCQDHIHRSDLACGSTVGPITAAGLAVRTVDVGCAMLSMHSIREMAGSEDIDMMSRVLKRVLAGG